jgi:hypothetical protein
MRLLRYCRDVFYVALRPSISWAQFIIAIIIIIVGCAIWLATGFGMTIDPSDLVTMVRSPTFYVMLVGVVVAVRLVFAQYWMWVDEHKARISAENQIIRLSGPVITPVQEKLLGLIAKYQGQFAANKLVIGRSGNLTFDGQRDKGKDINLIVDLYGANSPAAQQNFVDLMHNIPLEYLRYISEMRWNSPFVVSLTDRGMRYLRGLVK